MKKPKLVLYFLYMVLSIGFRAAAFLFPFMDQSLAGLCFILLCIPGLIVSVRSAIRCKEISLNQKWMFILCSCLYGFWIVVSILMILMGLVGRFMIQQQ